MIKGRNAQILAAVAVSLATASMGTFSGWSTPVLPKLKHNETAYPVNEDQMSWMLGVSPLGFIAGSLATRFLSDSFGRRTSLILSALPMTAGTIILVTAITAEMLYATTFLWGVGTGVVSTVASIYLAEIGDKDLRATLSMVTRISFNFGMLLVVSVGPLVSFSLLNYTLFVLPVLSFAACLLIPESPYYLLKEGRVDQARVGLSRLHGKRGEELESHLNELRADVHKETKKSSSFYELVTGKQYRRAVIIAIGLKLSQILTGIVAVRQYLGLIIDEDEMAMKVDTALIVFAAIRFLVSFVSSFFVDRVGRVPLLVCSYVSTGITFVIVGIYFYMQSGGYLSGTSLRVFSYVTFICIVLASVIATVGFDSITIVVHAEIFPLNVKNIAMTSLNVLGGCLGTVLAKLYIVIKSKSGMHSVFWCFAIIAFAGAMFSAIMVPETKGKSLKEIQVILQGDVYNDVDGKIEKDLIPKIENVEEGSGDTELKVLNSKL